MDDFVKVCDRFNVPARASQDIDRTRHRRPINAVTHENGTVLTYRFTTKNLPFSPQFSSHRPNTYSKLTLMKFAQL